MDARGAALTGARERPLDMSMATLFVQHALEFRGMSEAALLNRFGGGRVKDC
jgi:hypothetical protein